MYIDYYLKFDTEAEGKALLYRTEHFQEQTYLVPNYLAVDAIGTVYKPTGNMLTSEEGMQFPEMAPVDGWHANVRVTEEKPELEPYRVHPNAPVRVWA